MLGRLLGSTAATAVAVMLVVSACSGGDNTSGRASTSVAATRPTATTAASGGVGPTVATTAIPGAPGAPTTAPAPGGTLAPQPTTTIPLQPGAPAPPAPTDPPSDGGAVAPTTTPGPASPPVTDIVDGDPTTFCPAVERALPLYYVVSIGGLVGGPGGAAAYEVAVAPALAGPLADAATSAPSVVAPPFTRWADRTALALAAFKAAGATDAQVATFGRDYAARIEALTDEGGSQNPPDPIDAAVAAGIDRSRLMAAAATFQSANGSFDSFSATLGQDVTLTPAAQQKLEQLFPCAGDLTNFVG